VTKVIYRDAEGNEINFGARLGWRHPQRRRDQPQRQYERLSRIHHLGAWDQWASRFLPGLSARSFGSRIVAERDGNSATVSAGQASARGTGH
jgi:hypothetical protein